VETGSLTISSESPNSEWSTGGGSHRYVISVTETVSETNETNVSLGTVLIHMPTTIHGFNGKQRQDAAGRTRAVPCLTGALRCLFRDVKL